MVNGRKHDDPLCLGGPLFVKPDSATGSDALHGAAWGGGCGSCRQSLARLSAIPPAIARRALPGRAKLEIGPARGRVAPSGLSCQDT